MLGEYHWTTFDEVSHQVFYNLMFACLSLQLMLGEYYWTTFDEVSHQVFYDLTFACLSLQLMLGEYHWTTFDEVSHQVFYNLMFACLSLQLMLGEYHWTTFDEVSHQVDSFGQGLLALGLDPRQYILLFAETRMEYMVAVQAAFKFNFPGGFRRYR